MTAKTQSLLAIILVLVLALAGLAVALPMYHDGFVSQDSGSCATHCLGKAPAPTSALLSVATTLPLVVLVFLALWALAPQIRAACVSLRALARPSPNLICLYAHRLD